MNLSHPDNWPKNQDSIVRIENLVTCLGNHIVHEGLNLELKPGEVLGVVGGSGSGKTVLLKMIIGLLHPKAGRIEILGHDTSTLSPQEWRALQLSWGVLFQEGALFSSMTVAENIEVPLREHTSLSPDLRSAIIQAKISMVGLPPSAASKYPSELSGGMRKRASLARALALDPRILFLDEPTSGLDPIGASEFDQLIQNLHQSLGLTVFMITHDLDTIVAICDRVAVLVDKKIKIGTLDEIVKDPHPWIQSYFHGPRGRAAQQAHKR